MREVEGSGEALVVDDDASNLRLMTLTLSLDGFEPATAATGAEAEAALAAELPAVVLVDLALPDIDGTELVRRLRGRSRTAELPILVVSASAGDADIEAARAAGCDRFLAKPIDTRTFAADVRATIDDRRRAKTST